MDAKDFQDILSEHFGEGTVLSLDDNATPMALEINPAHIVTVCEFLHENEKTYFDLLSCVTGIDNGPETNTMEVVYNLYSIPMEHSLMLKATLSRENPEIDTITPIWKAAEWHEREAYDLFGIVFKNHPDLRRILMPADWEGYPMRKDYVEPEEYRGMKTIREEGDPNE